ncbi:hypothetical protein GCM10027589_14310 [Actinocorallia lasiicapitis]
MRRLFSFLLPILLTLTTVVVLARPAGAAPPAEFDKATVATGLDTPTDFRFTPDGRILIAEQHGAIRLYKNGALQTAPMVTLSTWAADERGLLGLEIDPAFATNGYVYAAYTHADNYDRLSRFTVTGDTISAASELVLLKSDQVAQVFHHGGEVRFGPDGKLYWGLGMNLYNPNSQNLNSIHGKILRINPDGTVPADNPFVGTPGAKPAIWAYGLRNPFRFDIVPDGPNAGKILAGDVGGSNYEELDLVTKGGNYGWAEAEGPCAGCGFIDPVFAYPHTAPPANAGSITSVAVYTGTTFPSEFQQHVVFYADYTLGFIKYLEMDHEYSSVIEEHDFDLDAGTPVKLAVGPDGNLYQLNIFPGELFKISLSGGNRAPVANAAATPSDGLAPLAVAFSSAGSADPDGTPLTYLWDFKDGSTSTEPNPSHTFTATGSFPVTLTVSDGAKTGTATVPVTVGNRRPTGTITSPVDEAKYNAGDVISYSATGTDPEDGTLPASAYSWSVIFHHADHIHPFLGPVNGVKNGTFTIPRNADNLDTTWYEIKLTVTDAGGLTHTSSVDVKPNLVTLTFNATPAGAKYTIDGIPFTGAHTEQAVVGVDRVLGAPSQTIGGTPYVFGSWSDGGTATHTVRTPAADTAYTVAYTEVTQPPAPWTSTDIGARTQQGSTSYNAGTFTVTGHGNDIWGDTDEFRFVHQPLNGDGSIIARLTSQTNTAGWAKAGIMIKETATEGAKYAAVAATPAHGMHFQFNFTGDSGENAYTFPNGWMKLTRTGNLFTAYKSPDGVAWTPIGTTTLSMAANVKVGLFVSAHELNLPDTATFDNVSVVGDGSAGAPPSPWQRVDLGGAVPAGSATYTNGSFTVKGAGSDIWGTADQASYLWQPLAGDGTITTRVASQTNTSDWAKAGVMVKAGTATGAPYAALMTTPGHGQALQWNFNQSTGAGTATGPVWLRLVRRDTTVTAFTSPDGTAWTQRGTATVALGTSATVGLFVCSHNGGTLGTGVFDQVSVTTDTQWVQEDIGGPALAGDSSVSGSLITATGSGGDVWNDVDQARYVHQSLSGDGTVVAHLTGQTGGDPEWAKAGIVIKSAATSLSPYVTLSRSTGHGVHLQANNGLFDAAGSTTPTADVWLKLVRAGDTFTGWESPDGVTWTRVGSVTRTLAAGARAGVFVTSHDNGSLSTATFTDVSVAPRPASGLPAGWAHQDVGPVGLAGNAYLDGRTYVVTGGGADIWGTADQFHYAYRSLPGDGSIVARIVTQENTSPWGKAGVMIKQSTTAGSAYAALMLTPENGLNLQTGFNTNVGGGAATAPVWVRLTRSGSVVSAYRSADGETWTLVGTATVTGAATIGLFSCAHDNGKTSTTTFDGVVVS